MLYSCWLSLYEGIVWGMVGPILICVIATLATFLVAVRAAFTLKDQVVDSGNMRSVSKTKKSCHYHVCCVQLRACLISCTIVFKSTERCSGWTWHYYQFVAWSGLCACLAQMSEIPSGNMPLPSQSLCLGCTLLSATAFSINESRKVCTFVLEVCSALGKILNLLTFR